MAVEKPSDAEEEAFCLLVLWVLVAVHNLHSHHIRLGRGSDCVDPPTWPGSHLSLNSTLSNCWIASVDRLNDAQLHAMVQPHLYLAVLWPVVFLAVAKLVTD